MEHKQALVASLAEKLGDIPTKDAVLKEYERILNIEWFKPMAKPPKETEKTVKLALKLFGVEAKIEYKKLETVEDWDAAWDAARDAAWGAAWDAAWGAAWGAAWECVSDLEDLKKKYPQNPFKVLTDLWEMGFYVTGIVKGKFVLYYVPKK